jgi:hypothetical protein
VVTAADWMEAFRLVWEATFRRIAVGVAPPMEHLSWANRRSLCLWYAARCIDENGDQELAAAWFTLGAYPRGFEWRTAEGHKNYTPVLVALARAIVTDPTLLDDESFANIVEGLRFLERAGSDGEDDLIRAARVHGGMAKIDKDRLLAWARA